MRGSDLIIGMVLIFILIVYMLTIPTILDHLILYLTPSGEWGDNIDLVHRVAVLYVPLIYVLIVLVWGLGAATREEAYYGPR